MAVYNFRITENLINELSVEDYEALERAQDGEARIYRIRPLACRFMVDEKGKPISQAQALKLTAKLKMTDLRDFLEQFFTIMRDTLVPKVSGNSSNSPSEAAPAGSEFPDGSQPSNSQETGESLPGKSQGKG